MRIFTQHHIQTASVRWCQDLAPIVFADSSNSVGVKNAAFEKIESSKKFHALQAEESLRQIGEMKIESPEAALVGDVVDRQNRAERQSVSMHEHRHQSRGPVVHV